MDLDNTLKSLKREVSLLRDKLTAAELKLAEVQRAKLRERVGVGTPFKPRKPTKMAEIRPLTPTRARGG